MISNYLTHKILDEILGNTAYSVPSTVYVALFTTMPNSAGVGGVEVTGGGYGRVASTNNTTNWPNASSRVKQNGTAITFVQASADWGNVVGVGLYDTLSGGNLLFFGDFVTSIPVFMNDVLSLTPAQFQITVN